MKRLLFLILAGCLGLSSLEVKMLARASAGEISALNQAFVLLSKSDGADAEDVEIAIGQSITEHPRNFLAALKLNRTKVIELGSLVANCGDECVDDFAKTKNVLEARLKAIESVKDGALQSVRTECETQLKKRIAAMSGN